MKKNKFGLPEKNLSKESREKLHLENEILRIKLKATTGGDLRSAGRELPPEVEYLFLKNILAFEEDKATSKLISLYEYIGSPCYPKADDLEDDEVETALNDLTDIMFHKNITIGFGSLNDNRSRYTFITKDLFTQQINDIKTGGVFLHFQYEMISADHEQEIRGKALEFLSDWFDRTMGKFSWELAEKCILPDGTVQKKEQVLEKFGLIFDAYKSFQDCQYLIRGVSFELKEWERTGSGQVDGGVKYQALLENGELRSFDGPFKLFLTLEDDCWRICYFEFPGFEW